MVRAAALALVVVLLLGCGVKIGKARVSGMLKVKPMFDSADPTASLDTVGIRVRIPLQ